MLPFVYAKKDKLRHKRLFEQTAIQESGESKPEVVQELHPENTEGRETFIRQTQK
jgi:hypothetical protein